MKNVKYFFDIIKKLNDLLTIKQKIQSIKALFWMFVSSVFEMLGISIIIPFISALLNPEELMKNQYISWLVDLLNIQSYFHFLIVLVVGIIVVYLIKNLLLIYSKSIQVKYQCQIQEELSLLMLDSYMKRPYSYFVKTNSTSILRGVIDDIDNIFTILQTIFTLVAESITVVFIVAYIIYTDWFMAVGIVCVVCVSVVALTLAFKDILKKEGVRFRNINMEKSRSVLQISQGIKDIFVMQRKGFFVRNFEKTYDEFKKSRIIYSVVSACPERVIEAVFITSILLIVCLRMGQGIEAANFVPQLGAFAVAGYRLLPSINKFSSGLNQIVFLMPALNAAYDNITIAKEHLQSRVIEEDRNSTNLSFDKVISVQNLTWKYDDSENNILENVSFDIYKGDSIAFIGESGSGKTTLADILLGLYKPLQGKVLVDGNNIYSNLERWSEIISYVPQTVYLMDDTIKANILFGHVEADEDRIWHALEQAQLKEFVESLPDGLDTLVGEAGVRFSGGQRQRIAIARALYCSPNVLLLDEATAALDNDTESAVMEAIESLKGKKTLIIIAHRLSTIKNCNKVYEVKNGQIEDVTTDYVD